MMTHTLCITHKQPAGKPVHHHHHHHPADFHFIGKALRSNGHLQIRNVFLPIPVIFEKTEKRIQEWGSLNRQYILMAQPITATLDHRHQHQHHHQQSPEDMFSKRWIQTGPQPLTKPAEIHGGQVRPGRPDPAAPLDHILFQGFNWESPKKYPWYQVVHDQVKDLVLAGITDIWLPPPSQSVDVNGYLPSQLYNLNDSKYGTKAQLEELIDALHMNGICCMADIVINHRSGYKQDSGGHWNVFEGGTKDERLDWGPWAVVDNDAYDSGGKGHHDTGESYGAAPDLDHTNKRVQDELTDWMNWLKADIGFDGWRFDFVKGYAPEFTKMYCERTYPTFSVGELWTSLEYQDGRVSYNQNAHRQVLCDWIDGTNGLSFAFDFTTKGILQAAVCGELWRLKDPQGKPPGLLGWYPQRAVTFIDNHDTGSTQRHWNFPDDNVFLGYVYILTHPGVPCIFYDHFFSWGFQKQIGELIQLRKRAGVNAGSKICIEAADADMYVASIDNKLLVKLGPRFDMGSLLPDSSSWRLALSGKDYAIWESTKAQSNMRSGGKESALDTLKREGGAKESTPDTLKSSLHHLQSSHQLKLSGKMSCKTVRRLLDEVPNLVQTDKSHDLRDDCGIKHAENKSPNEIS